MNYEIEARWAGYVVRKYIVESKEQITDVIETLRDDFVSGMEQSVQGSIMRINVLCVDVLHNGDMYLQVDFKA
jgi:hypothetical protein